MNYDLVGIGNALVDIEVRVDDAFVEQWGLNKGRMTLADSDKQAEILKALSGHPTKISSGGSAANTVHGVSVLGAGTYYLGRVANDLYGQHYSEDMRACGVGFSGPGAETNGTGSCLVLITPDAERTMVTHLGISSALHPDNVDETIVRGAGAVYIEGYLWTGDETRTAAEKLAQTAKKDGVPVAFTLSDTFVVNNFRGGLNDFIRWNVDILFCNEVEALAMSEKEDIDSAFDVLQGMAETVFLTLGAKGSRAGRDGGEQVTAGTFPITPVDTTGAGDLYAAGALYGLLNDYSLEESAIMGSYCAAQVVTHMGARMPVHSHTDANKILREYESLGNRG